jgi:hypothetical protein
LLGLAELAREDEDLDEAWELAHHSLEILDGYGDRVGSTVKKHLSRVYAKGGRRRTRGSRGTGRSPRPVVAPDRRNVAGRVTFSDVFGVIVAGMTARDAGDSP